MMAMGDQASDQIDHEVGQAAMAGVFDLEDIFQLGVDALQDYSSTQRNQGR
jgi:hypothetical protein